MPYFASALARTPVTSWTGRELDLGEVEDLDGADRRAAPREPSDADVVVLFVEEDDEWFGIVRVDERRRPARLPLRRPGHRDQRDRRADRSEAATDRLGRRRGRRRRRRRDDDEEEHVRTRRPGRRRRSSSPTSALRPSPARAVRRGGQLPADVIAVAVRERRLPRRARGAARRVTLVREARAPMRLALDEARRGLGAGDVPVGAVVRRRRRRRARRRPQRARGRPATRRRTPRLLALRAAAAAARRSGG